MRQQPSPRARGVALPAPLEIENPFDTIGQLPNGCEADDLDTLAKVLGNEQGHALGGMGGIAGGVLPVAKSIVAGSGQADQHPAALQRPIVVVATEAANLGIPALEEGVGEQPGQFAKQLGAGGVATAAEEADRVALGLGGVAVDPVDDLGGHGHRGGNGEVAAVGLPAQDDVGTRGGDGLGTVLAIDQRQRYRMAVQARKVFDKGAGVAQDEVESAGGEPGVKIVTVDLGIARHQPRHRREIGLAENPLVKAILARKIDDRLAEQLAQALEQQVGHIVRQGVGDEEDSHGSGPGREATGPAHYGSSRRHPESLFHPRPAVDYFTLRHSGR